MGNAFQTLLHEVSSFGLTWLVQSSVLLTLGLLAGRLLSRSGPAIQSCVYRTTLVAVLICPFASAALSAAGFDALSLRLPSPPANTSPAADPPAAPQTIGLAPESSLADLPPRAVTGQALSISSPAQAPSPGEPAPAPAAPVWSRSVSTAAIAPFALSIWLMGSTFMAVRLWLGQARMRRLRASAVPAELEAEALCRDVARRMDVKSPTVWRSPFLFSPCLDGLRRPAILLPEDVGKNLRETFIHELAHLARRDGLWNWLRRWSTACLWGQPLLWVLSRRLEAAAEDVCDDYVVHWGAERAHYAGHLLELARRALPPAAPASVGMVSLRSMLAHRVVRILDTSRSLSTRAGTRASAAMAAVGLALTFIAGSLGAAGGGKADAHVASSAPDPQPEPADKTIRGQVVAPDGNPMAGATVIFSRQVRILNGIGDGYASSVKSESHRVATGADGRFELSFGNDGNVIATAPGFGLGYLLKDQSIRLTAGDLPITGRLVDLEGRPVAGVKVTLGQVWLPPASSPGAPAPLKNSDARMLKSRASVSVPVPAGEPFSQVGRLGLRPEGLLPDPVLTDSDGRFRIAGLGRDVLADLTFTGPAIATKSVKILTRPQAPIVNTSRDPNVAGLSDPTIYGATCTIPVEPTRPIEGFIRDAETKQPIPGAIVTAAALSGSSLTIEGLVSTETDAQGHYRLVGLPKEGTQGHKLSVYPPFDRPYFVTRRVEAPSLPGYEPLKFDIALKSAIWITGTVTDIATGKPVAAAVDYFPMLTNNHAKDYPNFNPNQMSIAVQTRYKTDAAGHFRIVGLPGEGVVTAHTDDKSYRGGVGAESIKGREGQDQLLTYDRIFVKIYQSLKQVSVPEGKSELVCDLGVDPGGSLRLRLVDESGKPATNTAVWGRNPEGTDHGDHNLYKESIARIAGLEPGKPRTVLIKQLTQKIGAVLTIGLEGPRKDAEMTVTLRSCATIKGRLVDGDGKPVTGGVRVELVPGDRTTFQRIQVAAATVDSDGRFNCDDLPAGGPYQISAANRTSYGLGRRMEPETFKPFVLAKDLKLEPGQHLDFGTVDVNTGKRVDIPPAGNRVSADVPITGRIVNLEGQPIAGVSVKVNSVLIPKSDDLAPWLVGVKGGEPPWVAHGHIDDDRKDPDPIEREATTGKDGRFQLKGFRPDRVVTLELNGGMIAYTTLDVVTRKIDPFPAAGFDNQFGPGNQTIFGADFTYTATPSRLIEGVVKDAKTGQGLANCEIRSSRFAGTNYIGIMILRTKTDGQGRFRLAGLPKGKGNQIIIVPSDEQPYFMQELKVPDPPGAGPVEVSLALERGIWIEGKVTEKATGMALPSARLHYFPFLENKFAQAHPVFHSSGNTDGVGFQDRYVTKPDGTFRMVGLPGRAIVGAIIQVDKPYLEGAGSEAIKGMNSAGHFETYRNPVNPSKLWPTVMKEINPPADAMVAHVDLQGTTGPSVRVSVVDPAGKPLAGLRTNGRFGRSSHDRDDMTKPDAEVLNLMPDEERIVVLRHEGRKLGKVVTLKKGDDASGPVVVKLAPLAAITGRVVDDDGNPIPGVRIRPDVLPHGDFGLSFQPVVTGADGRFRVSDVPAGCDYGLSIEASARTNQSRYGYHSKAEVKPGETTDIGEFKFK
jgi:beta-lactamase regulating signal transducer with metallopeptidase domain